ncbi:MAG: 50S ribosomal protein L9 [Clostridium sp.]|nr:50S ribosomal protein L9 [Clostridium sp.]
MKVILKEDIKGLGSKEELVNVNDGYARNFLIPRGLAVEATPKNMNIMKTKRQAEENKRERELAQAKGLAKKIDKIKVTFKVKAGENGKLFGSITGKDISDYLEKHHNINIDRKRISLGDAIKSLGSYKADIRLYAGVSAKLTVKIEQDE